MPAQHTPKSHQVLSLLKTLAHPARLALLCELAHKGERSVTQLVAACPAGQSQVSQFLRRLRDEKLVATRRDGQTIYYRLASTHAGRVIDALCRIYR